ncbi:MAG: MurR/RpiR family transcriptional regulator [Actinomycetota bacterium]|nr:MurR/RpiR family transcriptional regulator [Actinomycetota bacterium]
MSDAKPDSRLLLVRIRAQEPSLRPSEARIAKLFLADPASAAGLSIAEVADRCRTSTTSVVRFCKRIGYGSYRDLRIDLTREATRESIGAESGIVDTKDIDRNDRLDEVVAKIALNETLSIADTARALDLPSLEKAVATLLAARRIDVFGVGASSVVRLDLQQKLTRIGLTTLGWDDAHSAWTSASVLDSECVAIAISHSGATTDTLAYVKLARKVGATTIVITNFADSPVALAADIVLTTAARENSFRSGALGSRIAQLMVVDCLFTGVAQASYDRSMASLNRTYSAIVENSGR